MLKSFDTVEKNWEVDELLLSYEMCNQYSFEKFRVKFANLLRIHSNQVTFHNSGALALETLLKNRKKREVLLPAFNCKVVGQAVVNAGCIPILYDFSQTAGSFEWEYINSLLNEKIGAIIVTHYFGVPTNFSEIINKCKKYGILIVEDCAHTLGGQIDDRISGSIGDASIFSFNYDKPLSLGWGGALVINNSKINKYSDSIKTVNHTGYEVYLDELIEFDLKMKKRKDQIRKNSDLFTKLLYKLRLLKVVSMGPKIALGFSNLQAELGVKLIEKYENTKIIRNSNAKKISDAFPGRTWNVDVNVKPAWLKQKLKIESNKDAKNLAHTLQKNGWRVGLFNWDSILSGRNYSTMNNALKVCQTYLDIPIHQNIDDEQMEILINLIKESMGQL